MGLAPPVDDECELFVERAGDDSVVGDVVVECSWVAASQFEGRGCFPGFGEAVDPVEFVDTSGDGEFALCCFC